MDYDVKPFLESTADWNKDPNAYLKRYYSLYHKRGQEGEVDVYVRQAPNKICVLGLLEPSRDYKSIKFNTELIGEKIKRDTVLCELLDGEGQTVVSVKAHMEGKLLELHTELVDDLDLLFNRPLDHGFIAVIMPKHEDSNIQLAAIKILFSYIFFSLFFFFIKKTMGQATSSVNKISFFTKKSDSVYEDISNRFTKATVSTLAVPVVIVAYPVLNAYTFKESDITGFRIIDGAIGGLLGVIAWPLAPFFAVWGAVTFIFKERPPTPLSIPPEIKARAEAEINLNTTLYYNVAIVGTSGSGKSSLVNAILGYKDTDKKAAKVGEIETTSKPTAYIHPDLVTMMIWDMPGVGTRSHSRETYFEENFLCAFDLLVIVLGNRLMQDDIDIALKAKEHKIPVLFVRSKADQAISSKKARHQGTEEFVWATAVGEFVLEVKDSVFSQLKQCQLSTKKLFIVSSHSLRQFVTTINKKEKRKTLQLIDEERFMTSLIEGVLAKRRVTKKKAKLDGKKKH